MTDYLVADIQLSDDSRAIRQSMFFQLTSKKATNCPIKSWFAKQTLFLHVPNEYNCFDINLVTPAHGELICRLNHEWLNNID